MEGLLKFRVWVDDQNPSTVQMDLSVEHRAVFANGATVAVLSLDAAQPQDKGSVQPTAANTQMATALWRELRRRRSNRLVPLRGDWVAVTEERLNAAVAALRHS